MSSALAVVDLTKKYGQFTAVREVTFAVPAGSVVGLLGPNGSGKSSVLHCITGIVALTAGTITMGGYPHHAAAAKAILGFVPDDLSLPMNLTGAEYLDLVRRLQPACDRSLMRELLELLGLEAATGKLVAEYSHGMKRKLQMVAAMSHSPSLLILDEPFRGLDPEAHLILRTLMDSFVAAGGGVLVATHDLVAAQTYCHTVSIFCEGEIAAAGAPLELMMEYDRSSLEEVFLAAAGIEERTKQVQQRISEIRLHTSRNSAHDRQGRPTG
ncbi:ABC transporter ATP-binding protein [Frankia sp. Cas4]|uniref:ABC transporter ATP-binding protein n=1 Tax=Frankia sp. Cas4 TaxID=3073927 RepID=UPI002AD4A8A7|nr:ABC transporter ATP-binding protein [Frankia sp. Cas4]